MDYTELRNGRKIILDGDPYVVVSYEFSRKQQRKAVVKTQLRNLITGRVLPKTFTASDSVQEANLSQKKAQYLYSTEDAYTFMDTATYDQFELTADQIGDLKNYLVEGSEIEVQLFKNKPISVDMPLKVDLKVIDAPPGAKGDTATSASKPAKLESGFSMNVPLFINEGDIIKVNTETGEYVERVNS